MKLVLYSDQIASESAGIDEELMRLLEPSTHRVAFIPSESDRRRRYFARAEEHYGRLGLPPILHCDIDAEWDPRVVAGALACDAIHLGSGDPMALADAIRRRELERPLRDFVGRGGILIGVSAGAMVMSRSLALAAALDDDGVARPVSGGRAKKTGAPSGLGLVEFDFYPHFEEEDSVVRALTELSRSSARPIHACSDSQGIVVDGTATREIGAVVTFHRGAREHDALRARVSRAPQ